MLRVSPLMFRNFTYSIQGRNYPDDTWVFMLVVVCQIGVSVRTPPTLVGELSGIFLILNKGGALWHQ